MNTLRREFIYTPQSGSRVFAKSFKNASIALCTYTNMSHEVFGGAPVLTWHTAWQGSHWRDAAHTIATQIIHAHGGVAWDAQGDVHMVVPCSIAVSAMHWMDSMADAMLNNYSPDPSNTMRLIAAGLASPTLAAEVVTPKVSQRYVEDVDLDVGTGYQHRYRWKGDGEDAKWTWDELPEGECEIEKSRLFCMGIEREDSTQRHLSSPQWAVYEMKGGIVGDVSFKEAA